MKKVSIVLPTYNGEQYIKESIDSVLKQTYENWELLIVDDCSTDNTARIIQEYARKDSRIMVIRNEVNQKLPGALNTGFRAASGEYYTWTSDDNMYDDDAIELMVDFLEKNPEYGMVYYNIRRLDENGNFSMGDDALEPQYLYTGSYIGACFMYRREVAETVGEYDPDMFLVEDYDYWLRISKRYKLHFIPQCKYTYRVHSASLSTTRIGQFQVQAYRIRLRELDYLLEKIDNDEKEILFLTMWANRKKQTWDLREKFFPDGILPERLKWIEQRACTEETIASDQQLIFFGAGEFGQKALKYFGRDRVRCFVDNNPNLAGTEIEGIPVVSFADLMEIREPCQILITVGRRFVSEIANQLEAAGLTEYTLFLGNYERLVSAG